MKLKDIELFTALGISAFPELDGASFKIKVMPHSHKPYNFIYFVLEGGIARGLCIHQGYIKVVKKIAENVPWQLDDIWALKDEREYHGQYEYVVNKLLVCVMECDTHCEDDDTFNGDYMDADSGVITLGNSIATYIKTILVPSLDTYGRITPDISKSHNLICTIGCNEHLQLELCLNKLPPIGLVENIEFSGTVADMAEYGNDKHIGYVISQLNSNINVQIVNYLNHNPNEKITEYRLATYKRFIIPAISQLNRAVYTVSKEAVSELIDGEINKLLIALNDFGIDVRLDLSSFVIWHHDGDNDPVVFKTSSYMNDTFKYYTKEFGDLVYSKLLGVNSKFVRPHTEMKKIVDEQRTD